jgi:hypothetical protein
LRRRKQIAREYAAAHESGERVLVISPANDERRELNKAIRAVLIAHGHVALAAGTLFVERSRSLRSKSAPKTSAAARVVRLTARNVEVLRQMIELRAGPDDYVFKNSPAARIDQRSFYKIFCVAQRVKKKSFDSQRKFGGGS